MNDYSRLPPHVLPIHYKLHLEPNFETFTFKGQVEILIEVTKTVDQIVINAKNIEIIDLKLKKTNNTSPEAKKSRISVEGEEGGDDSNNIEIKEYEVLEEEEVLVMNLSSDLSGFLLLSVRYLGLLDDSMRGFYRTEHSVAGERKWGAACHFEATGARKCFPCFDQPEFRSSYDISVLRPEVGQEVLSNMPVASDSEGVVTFQTSPPLPSYLVCVVVGWYSSVSGQTASGTPVTIFTPPGQASQGEVALDVTLQALEYFKDFFSVPYTLPKMDLVAVPDFYIGAMENWGLLTFRENYLLYDEISGTLSSKQNVAIIVCHEIAHQWFGNLVGIEWWDQLWLKEGFATWVSFLAVDKIFPEFDIWSNFLTEEKMRAMDLDRLSSSHPIEIPDGVQHPAQIDEIFDAISYCKGASVINMLYHWMSPPLFQSGISRYLENNRGRSASNQKLWAALEEVAGCEVPVSRGMEGWTQAQGFPLVMVEILPSGMISLKQEPFVKNSPDQTWIVPLTLQCFSASGQTVEQRVTLGDSKLELSVSSDLIEPLQWLLVNAGQTSFCRVMYSPSLLVKLCEQLSSLTIRDRVGLLSDSMALFTSQRMSLDLISTVLQHFAGQVDYPVIQQVLQASDVMETFYEGTEHWAKFLTTFYNILTPSLNRVGFQVAKAAESDEQSLARSNLVSQLGHLGHTDTVGKCWILWGKDFRGEMVLHPDLKGAVYGTVARTGKRDIVELLMKRYSMTESAEERRMLKCLARSTVPDIAKRTLQWVLTDQVKHQDKTGFLFTVASTGSAGRELVWKFFTDNKDHLLSLYTSGCLLTGLILAATGAHTANTLREAERFEAWFRENKIPGTERTIQQVIEEIRNIAELRAKWL